MPTQLQRDPFARATLMRVKYPHAMDCKWCGRTGRVWRYYWETDGGTRYPQGHRYCQTDNALFCSVGCYRAYYA